MKKVRVVITRPDFWYENYVGAEFDVFRKPHSFVQYELLLTEHNRSIIEAHHGEKMHGWDIGDSISYEGLWIHTSDLRFKEYVENKDAIHLLNDSFIESSN